MNHSHAKLTRLIQDIRTRSNRQNLQNPVLRVSRAGPLGVF
jgi:hypothetical protein